MRGHVRKGNAQSWALSTAAGVAAVLLCSVTLPAYADSQKAVGTSPADYASPTTDAQKELKAFQNLVQLRDSGQISPPEFQALLLKIAASNKKGVRLVNAPMTEIVDPIVFSPKSHPLRPLPHKPVTPPSDRFISLRLPLTSPPPSNKMQAILRPKAGPVVSVTEKEIAR